MPIAETRCHPRRSARASTFAAAVESPLAGALTIALLLVLTPRALSAQVLTVTDATGDVSTPTLYVPADWGAPLTVSGDQVEWTVPSVLLPTIDNWLASSYVTAGTPIDLLPDAGVIHTTGGTVGDVLNDVANGLQDLASAAIIEGADETLFQVAVREIADPRPSKTKLTVGLNFPMGGGLPERWIEAVPSANSPNGWGSIAVRGSTPFPYQPKTYYDIVAADANHLGSQLVFNVEVAANLPAVAEETSLDAPFTVAFTIGVDIDGDPATGDPSGNDRQVTAYYAPGGTLTGRARVYNGNYFVPSASGQPALGVNQNIITMTVPTSGLGIDRDEFSWQVTTYLAPFQPGESDLEEFWVAAVDSAPRHSYVIFRDGFEDGDLGNWSGGD